MLIVTGATSGTEEGVLEAASEAGFPTDGFIAAGARTIGGARPEVAERFKLSSLSSPLAYEATKAMAQASDLVIFLGSPKLRTCKNLRKHVGDAKLVTVNPSSDIADYILTWHLLERKPDAVYITGDREDRSPGTKERVKQIVKAALEKARGYDTPLPVA